MIKVIDLFSGIGGFSLGLERAGPFQTVQFVEQDDKARQVLRKHWPDVPQHNDIRTYQPNPGDADLVCGGFPCQDISSAGRGVGIVGERSGLWSEMARVIGAVRPRWVIAENVSALRSKGLTLVLQDLCSLGYDAEWHCIPASAIGAPHRRDRVWIIAYRSSDGQSVVSVDAEASGVQGDLADTIKSGAGNRPGEVGGQRRESPNAGAAALRQGDGEIGTSGTDPASETVHNTDSRRHRAPEAEVPAGRHGPINAGWWSTEPPVGRVVDGLPGRVDRLKQLGNSIVPQIATLLGKAILRREGH